MQGKVVVITGATSGIGEVAAQRLAGMGARIVLVARDAARGQKTLTRLPASPVPPIQSTTAICRAFLNASALRPRSPPLRHASMCSSTMPAPCSASRQVTADNLEKTFATNHMAYFVLTRGLEANLLAAAPARVVSTASDAHKGYTLDFDDLQSARSYSAIRAYGRSKLCNILFTRELARRWRGKGVSANCLHPGFVATRFGDGSGGFLSSVVRIAKTFAIRPEKGAETIVYLASSPEVAAISGEYFYKCRPAMPTAGGRDDAAASIMERICKNRGTRGLKI
jgi:NAD(P)-dependent dehydrogenase (short-subunit alcohol dehydrogenase family)